MSRSGAGGAEMVCFLPARDLHIIRRKRRTSASLSPAFSIRGVLVPGVFSSRRAANTGAIRFSTLASREYSKRLLVRACASGPRAAWNNGSRHRANACGTAGWHEKFRKLRKLAIAPDGQGTIAGQRQSSRSQTRSTLRQSRNSNEGGSGGFRLDRLHLRADRLVAELERALDACAFLGGERHMADLAVDDG